MRTNIAGIGLLILAVVLTPSVVAFGQDNESAVPIPSQRPAQSKPVVKNPSDPAPEIAVEAAKICTAKLEAIAIFQSTNSPEMDDAGCVIQNPVSLSTISHASGSIKMPVKMLNNCEFALRFSHWVSDVANPLAKHHLGSGIAAVRSGPGFVCRRRNNLPTGKLSEHAFGTAIDISGFKLENGNEFQVQAAGKLQPQEALFLDALRKTACGYFTTVLGPGSNSSHDTHLHLDIGIHGKSGNYRICE